MARWVKSSGENVNLFRRVSAPGLSNDVNVGDLWADLSVAPPVLMKLTSVSPITWVSVEGGGGGGGEANTASNVGTAGVGVYKQKTGVNLELKNINAGSNKITITDDVANNEIDIDVAQANLSLGSIGGTVSYSQIQNVSATDKLLGRSTAGAGVIEEIALTSAGRALIDDIDASAQRTTLGLGSLATQSGTFSGTSSGTNTGDQTSIVGITGTKAQFNTAVTDGDILYVGDITQYTDELAQDAVGTILTDSSTIDFTYNDGANTITAAAITDTSVQKIEITKNSGAVVGTRKQLNFIEGTNVTLTVADDVANNQVDITIAAAGGGGVSDGDKGDITISGTGTVYTIDNDVVTYAKMQNVSATDRLLGRSTAGAGDTEEITCTAAGRAILDDVDAAAQRTTLGLGTLATQSGTFSGTSSGTNTGDQSLFSTIAVSGQSNVVADAASDTLTLVAGTNVTITTDAATDAITINASGGGGSGLTQPQVMAIASLRI